MTDEGLQELAGCAGLELINMRQSKITDAGVAELKKTLPKRRVIK